MIISENLRYTRIKQDAINEIMIINQEIKIKQQKKEKEKITKLIFEIKNNIVKKNIFHSSYISSI